MKNWLSSIFDNKNPPQDTPPADLLALQNELRRLTLENETHEQTITRLNTELENLRAILGERVQEALDNQRDELFRAAAAPAAQLVTQAHLLEVMGKPVQARDVLPVTRRLLRVLENYGLRFEGQIGEITPFNPLLHQPLNAADHPVKDQPVVVRIPAVLSGEKILARAGVELAQEQA